MEEDKIEFINYFIKDLCCCVVPLFIYACFVICFGVIGQKLNIDNNLAQIIGSIVYSLILYFGFFVPVKKRQLKRGIIKEKIINNIPYFWIAVLGVVCCLLLNCLACYGQIDSIYKSYERVAENLYSGQFIVIAIRMILIAPISEEIMYRGVIFNSLKSMTGKIPAVIVSSAIFGVMHGNLLQGIYAFVLGIVLVLLYEKYNLLTPCFIFHVFANWVSFIGTKTNIINFVFSSKNTLLFYIIMCSLIVVVIAVKLITMQDDAVKIEN